MTDSINWFGLVCHPTDNFIHWSLNEDAKKKKARELRHSYDSIPVEYQQQLQVLLDAAYQAGQADEIDSNAGEEL